MQCSHCNQEHPEGTQFCPVTGKKILIPGVCPQFGKPIDPKWLHCTYFGRKPIHTEGISNQQEAQSTDYPRTPITRLGLSKPRARSPKVPWLMIAGGIGGLLIVAAVVFNAFWKGTNHDEAASAATITPVAIITPTATILPTPFIEAPGRIAFESKRDGNEIYVMNADGSAQTHLTNNQADYNEPTWSADRHKIAFHSYRDGIIE